MSSILPSVYAAVVLVWLRPCFLDQLLPAHTSELFTRLTGFPLAEHAGFGGWLEPHCSCYCSLVVCKRNVRSQLVCMAHQWYLTLE